MSNKNISIQQKTNKKPNTKPPTKPLNKKQIHIVEITGLKTKNKLDNVNLLNNII